MFGFFYCCGNVSLYEYITVLLLIDIFFRSFDLCIRAPQDHPQDGWCTRKTCCVNSYSDLWIMPLWSFSCLLVFSWGLFCWVCAQSGLLNLRGCLIQLGWVMPNLIPQQCVRSHLPRLHPYICTDCREFQWLVCVYWWPFAVLFCNSLCNNQGGWAPFHIFSRCCNNLFG